MQKIETKPLKKDAVTLGGHIILVLSQTSQNGSHGIIGKTNVSFSDVAYWYVKQ